MELFLGLEMSGQEDPTQKQVWTFLCVACLFTLGLERKSTN